MDNLTWLGNWYGERCDGEWESDYGITIETVNNPGWMVRIDLDGTGLNPGTFKALVQQRTETDWIECKVLEGVWLGGGGMVNLDEVLSVFRAWAESSPSPAAATRKERMEPRQPQRGGPPPRGGQKPWRKR